MRAKMFRPWRPVAVAAAVSMPALLAGCMVGPDYKRPSVWSPTTYSNLHARTGSQRPPESVPVASRPDPQWWNIFGDPELTSIEARIARANLSVREATWRLVESRAQRQETAAALYPSLNATGSYMREKLPNRVLQRGLQQGISALPVTGSTVDGIRQYAGEATIPPVDLWQDAIDASYELDLWGQVRRGVEAADAQVESSADSRRSTLISAEAEAARDYMELRSLQAQLEIQRENLRTAQDSLTLTQQRFTGGLTTDLDVQNARAQLASTASAIPNLQQQIRQQVNALSLLLGAPPQALAAELDGAHPIPPVPPQVPVGIPSELVLRRPDVRQAAAHLHAATAQVGVAIAAFYPQVSLTGNLNELSLQFRDLFTWQSAGYGFGPSITLPLFEGGRLRGQLRLSRAQQAEAAVTYEQAVLQAWHDVDNALTAYDAEQRRRDQLQVSVSASAAALSLAQDQYAHGLVTFLNVLDAERTKLSADQQLVQSTATVSSNLVQLYTALGGGWEQAFPSADVTRSGVILTADGANARNSSSVR